MKEVAEAVNEDKRRMEDLESIDAWQGQVDGWTGPNLRDTSRQLIFKSPVTKYSLSKNKATSNDRWFFLFDNVLIYCKKVHCTACIVFLLGTEHKLCPHVYEAPGLISQRCTNSIIYLQRQDPDEEPDCACPRG